MAKQEYTIGDHDQKTQHAPGPGQTWDEAR